VYILNLPGREPAYDCDGDDDGSEDMQLDLNLLFGESDEAEDVDPCWEDERLRSRLSSGQHATSTSSSVGGSTDTTDAGLASAIRAREARDHETRRSDRHSPGRVDQTAQCRKRKRGSVRGGTTKKRRKRYRPYGPVTVRVLAIVMTTLI
jgi:hypothetical protein